MTIVRLGYVAMSVNVKNCSPSQTMTFTQFQKISDRDAAIRKLERIAQSNLENCLRLLKHNYFHDIAFFRFSSKIIPLANHEELKNWDYIKPLKGKLAEIGQFVENNKMRIGFHPDHFVLLNSKKKDIFNNSIETLHMHKELLAGMGIDPKHRCVLHVGGAYKNKEKALEQFVHNWEGVPSEIKDMIILENDDKTFTMDDTLYLCEALGIPMVFDYHHHLVNKGESAWQNQWERVLETWKDSPLPIKMHISSPKNEKDFRHHADYIDPRMFQDFLNEIKGSTPHIDCMIEAKKKDQALFQLMKNLSINENITQLNQASFKLN